MRLVATLWLAALLVASPLSASTTAIDAPAAATRKPTVAGGERIRSVVEIVAIDPAARIVTLKRDDGNTLTVVAGDSVRNFAQIGVGDFVIAEYGRAQALSLSKPAGNNGAHTSLTPVETKRKTVKPATHRKRIIADIIAIDDKRGQATLKGDKGQIVDVSVRNRKALAAVKIGEQVELEYTEAVAISLQPARTRPRKAAP